MAPTGRASRLRVAQLKAYDQGFADFFQNLSQHGINTGNTLFVVTADEGDHFAGGAPSPNNCEGVRYSVHLQPNW